MHAALLIAVRKYQQIRWKLGFQRQSVPESLLWKSFRRKLETMGEE
jgi:hypothetical protein